VVALYSLCVAWWDIGAWARRLCWRGSRGPSSNKAVLLTRELSVRCVVLRCVVHSAVSLLVSSLSTTRRILWLALDVVVGHISLLLIVDLLVGWIGRYGNNVPCVEETGEEAEHCWDCQSRVAQVVHAEDDLLQSAMLIRLSAEQMPLLTHTASGGKRTAMSPRKMSLPHMVRCGYGWVVSRKVWLDVSGVYERQLWKISARSHVSRCLGWRMRLCCATPLHAMPRHDDGGKGRKELSRDAGVAVNECSCVNYCTSDHICLHTELRFTHNL
jgi:hypothetical protein